MKLSENVKMQKISGFNKALIVSGTASSISLLLLDGRMLWEETSLTLALGPQMYGFSLAHGYYAFLLLSPVLVLLWIIVALVSVITCKMRGSTISQWVVMNMVMSLLLVGLLSIPAVFWQWLFVGTFARSAHAGDLMTYAAAEGDERTVRRYLDHGVPVEARNQEGSTAAFTAAVGDEVTVLKMLIARKANINAVNECGDSPLEAAVEMHNDAAETLLKSQGALRVRGTPERRKAAIHEQVMRTIERQQQNLSR